MFRRKPNRRNSKQRGGAPRARGLSFERLESRALLAAVDSLLELDRFPISGNVGEKPESKIWKHAESWWGVFSESTGTYVWRLDGSTWQKSLKISEATEVYADAKADGDVTHVLFRNNLDSQLYSLKYVPGPVPGYSLWSDRPAPASVSLSPHVEAATIDIDSQGRMWVAYDGNEYNIEVRYSDSPFSTWSDPIVLADNVAKDDIAALTALPNGTIGVLWSNQTTGRFGFRAHLDGTDPVDWNADEVPAAQSALNVGKGLADDHINLAVASDATLYAAVKTSFETDGMPKLGMLVRRPNGTWDDFHGLPFDGTRPAIQLNEALQTLIYSYNGGKQWVYHECNVTTIVCSEEKILVGTGENATSTKQNVTTDLVVLTSGKSVSEMVAGTFLKFNTPNSAPIVDAGPDQLIVSTQTASLIGVVRDDGLPGPPAVLNTLWRKVSGTGTVSFTQATARQTSAAFSQPGEYVVELAATDGELSGSDTVSITILPLSPNSAPATSESPREGTTKSFQDGVFPTATYNGTRDTKLRADKQRTNYGKDKKLDVDGLPDIASLLKWDVNEIPPSATVLGASITVNVDNTSTHSFQLYELLRDWAEFEATYLQPAKQILWNTPGAAGVGSDRGASVLGTLTGRTKGPVTVDLNAAGVAVVQKWVSTPAANYGLIVQEFANAAKDNLDVISSDGISATARPKLTIRFAAPSEPPLPVNTLPASISRNSDNPWDVNGDTRVTPLDVLLVFNALNGNTSGGGINAPPTTLFLDVSGDGRLTPFDALLIINHLTGAASALGEGEAGEGEAGEGEAGEGEATRDWILPVEPESLLEPAVEESIAVAAAKERIVNDPRACYFDWLVSFPVHKFRANQPQGASSGCHFAGKNRG